MPSLKDHIANTGCRCIVFDLDDTLYLERDYVRSGFRAADCWVRQEYGIEGFGKQCWDVFVSGRRRDIFDVVLQSNHITPRPDLIGSLVEVYRNHQPAIALLPDAVKCLEILADRVEFCLITDGFVGSQQSKIKALGIQDRFSVQIITGKWGQEFHKPHPRAFREIESIRGLVGSQCIYVADNPVKDFIAPNLLGWGTVRIRRAGGLYSDLPNHDPKAQFEFATLSPLIEGFGGESSTASFILGAVNEND